MTDVIAVIPAAGAGVRMEAEKNKAFLSLAGESIIRRTVKAFLAVECISEIYIMVNPLESKEMHNHLSGLANPYQTKIEVVPGGETRQDSVHLGLEHIANRRSDSSSIFEVSQNLYEQIKSLCQSGKKRTLCLVHDGARCLISNQNIQDYIKELKKDFFGLGVAVPLNDTIRRIDQTGKVIETPDRSSLRAMQTPQGSDFDILLLAHRYVKENNIQVTDDLAVLEAIQYPVKLFPGNFKNIKITHPEDIPIAEKLLKIE
ncbi:MAG: 2-C-methyl-D-erythritol 4-phosphate cytidylyltransferase [Clostridiaceae bacterium]|jgi:2-C-methyl-D-erythritol 4-phosphate cytidylyltransferase|nr:2-C-methyl-D-erythritol 4-phosphate cytidylyltransferase [Bacillota bacterium]NLN52235.1 2-C-methyl-D-erythritol 4-phosphate cytidylyltransferase [Clostridiaceae bacterium]